MNIKYQRKKKRQARDVNFLPIEEGVVEVFAEALQNPVMIPDGGSLILTGCKVTLQLRETERLWSHSGEKGNNNCIFQS